MEKYNFKFVQYGNGQCELRHYTVPIERVSHNKGKQERLPDMYCSNRSIKSSVNRSKQCIQDLVKSNQWEYFITLTFDNKYVDRTDYDLCLKKITKWFNNLRRKCPNLKYICVPEMHKRLEENNKHAYHFHGLISNCENLNILPSINSNGKQRKTKSGLDRFEIKDYKLGFSDATPVTDTFRVSNYILKYITKAECVVNKGKNRYIHSSNLDKPIINEYFFETKNPFIDIMKQADYTCTSQINVGAYQNKVSYYKFNNNPM